MRLVPTPEQEELRAAVGDFCAREITPERLRARAASAGPADAGLGEAVARLGWLGLGAPASAGGSQASLTDVATLFAECARGLLPQSLLGAVRGVVALSGLNPASPVLPALVSGERRLALALDEQAAREPRSYATVVETEGAEAVVRGAKAYVPEAAASCLHLVAAREADGISLVLVDTAAGGVAVEALRAFDGDPQGHVTYDGARVLERLSPPGGGDAAFARMVRRQRALALAEMVGGMEAVVETTVEYVKERDQFGQKIAVFQAVRHQVADMGTQLAAARHLAWRAITRIDRDQEQGLELASALAFVARAFKEVCFIGHHLHGGAGFVLEHPLHLHSERAQSLAIRHAPQGPALASIASALLD